MQKRFAPDAGGVFPEWEEVTLGDILEINPKTEEKIADEFYYADLASINNGVFTHGAAINHNEAPGRAQRVVHIDDVLFQSVNAENLGHYHYTKDKELDKQFVASTGFFLLRMKNGCNAFLYQLLFTKAFNQEVHKYSAGSIYPAINITEFKKIKVRIPKSIEEQRKIAAALAAYDEMIAVKTAKLETWQECKKRMVKEIFGRAKRFRDDDGNEFPEWEEKTLGEIAEIFDGVHQTPKYTEEGIKFVSVENIENLIGSKKYIYKDAFEKNYKNNIPKKNDIFMTRIGDVGRVALIETDEQLAFYVSLALVRTKNCSNVSPKYLLYAMESKLFQSELWKRTLHAAFPKKINMGEIGNCKIMIPKSLEEQQKIGSFLAEIDKEIEIQKEFIKTYAEGKKRMMRELMA